MMTKNWNTRSIMAIALVLLMTVIAADKAVAEFKQGIPVQGRLTDTAGNPLNGAFSIDFRLYEDELGTTMVCHDINSVTVEKGLFTSLIWGDCPDELNGRTLYLGIKVGEDPEMRPLQTLYAVPTAYTANNLVPGAVISGSADNDAMLHIENSATGGRGLRVYTTSETGTNYAVVGASRSPDGKGGYFYNTANGVALHSDSGGVSFLAGGSGIIRSTAQSVLWISGNGLRKYRESDSTIIDMDTVGGAFVRRGATSGNKNVMLPITIPGALYGQNIRVTGLQINWKGQTDLDAITALLLRRQTGVCNTCYATLLHDTAVKVCTDSTGCVTPCNLTINNELSPDSGALYLTIELSFSSSTSYVEIGSVKLILEHD